MLSAPVVAALSRSSINIDSPISRARSPSPSVVASGSHARPWNSTAASRIGRGGVLPAGELRSEPCAKCSSYGLVEEVGQAQLLAAGDRLVVHPLADRQVEYPHAERGENDRTATIH